MGLLKACFIIFSLCATLTLSSPLSGSDDSSSWRWSARKSRPEDRIVSVYLFNVTNPQETMEGGKPILVEIGPYVYREHKERFNISTTLMNTVKFQERNTYVFLPEESKGSEDDVINMVNMPMISAVTALKNVPFVGQGMIEMVMKAQEKLVRENVKVGDVLYHGIPVEIYTQIMASMGQAPPPQMAGGRFGIFKGKNGTDDGVLEVQEGGDYLDKIGDLISWKNLTELKFWEPSSAKCNQLRGRTDGTVFPANIEKSSVLNFFYPEVCRTLSWTYQRDEEINSVPGYRYIFPESMLEDPEKNPKNLCYCKEYDDLEEDYSVCLKKGVIDLFPCRGAPLVSSFPHFLDADPIYAAGVGGMEPARDLHESFAVIEPKTGTVLRSSLKFQLNIRTTNLNEISSALKAIPDYVFPVMWLEQSYTLNPSASAVLNSQKDDPDVLEAPVPGGNAAGPSEDAAAGGGSVQASRDSGTAFTVLSLSLLLLSALSHYL